jgi:hypothetical protein
MTLQEEIDTYVDYVFLVYNCIWGLYIFIM